jgi:type I restriction enzyme R subunit
LRELEDELQLTHYRLQKVSEQKLDLEAQDAVPLAPMTAVGSGRIHDLEVELSEVVKEFNARFPDVSSADLIGLLHPLQDRLIKSDVLADQARSNSFEQFEQGEFGNLVTDALLESHDTQKKLVDRIWEDRTVREQLFKVLAKAVYRSLTSQP